MLFNILNLFKFLNFILEAYKFAETTYSPAEYVLNDSRSLAAEK